MLSAAYNWREECFMTLVRISNGESSEFAMESLGGFTPLDGLVLFEAATVARKKGYEILTMGQGLARSFDPLGRSEGSADKHDRTRQGAF
jgi:hypothetical protein